MVQVFDALCTSGSSSCYGVGGGSVSYAEQSVA